MVSPLLASCLAVLIAGRAAAARESRSLRQDVDFVSVEAGAEVSLPCSFEGIDIAWLYWYKQTLGERPRMISSFYIFNRKEAFHDEFQEGRFSLEPGTSTIHLRISDVRVSDSGTYYCASSNHYQLEFAGGVFVDVKDSGAGVRPSVYQLVTGSASETLECTVRAGSCNGEHMVYWFRNPDKSNPGLIYAHGGGSDRCRSDSENQTRTCVLPQKGLNHSGTYHCAVASCGHILFGNGSVFDPGSEEHPSVLVFVLSGALAVTAISCVLLILSICKLRRQISCHCAGAQPSSETECNKEETELHYAALNADAARASRRQGNQTMTECVYSGGHLNSATVSTDQDPARNGTNRMLMRCGRRGGRLRRLHTTMMRLHLALFLTHVLTGPGAEAGESALVRQRPAFLAADVAGRVSLKCFSEAQGSTWIFWYKQTPRRKPVIVSGVYIHDKSVSFYNEFRNDSRFTLGTENDNYCLNISDLRTSDSGTYYCAASKFYDFEFAEGTVVSVGGLGASVRASVTADAGSRPLECRVGAGGVDGEHHFRDWEGSHPGVVRATEQTHTCGYNLLMDSRNTSRTGIYCAVASCGHILLGNQNNTDFGAKERDLGLLYLLSGTLAFTVTLTFSLAVSLCRRSSCNSKGSTGRSPSAANGEYGGDDPIHQYEPLTFEVPNRCRAKKTQSECVYSLASTSHIDTL